MGNESSISRTVTGKECKLCKKKGDLCHLHCDKEGNFDRFENLPIPAIEKILLQMNREELHTVCTESQIAAKVCKEERFQKLYNSLNRKQIIVGELERTDLTIFKDEIGTIIDLSISKDVLESLVYVHPNGLIIFFGRSMGKKKRYLWQCKVTGLNREANLDDFSQRFDDIGKQKWVDDLKEKSDHILVHTIYNKMKISHPTLSISNEIGNKFWDILKRKIVEKYAIFSTINLP